jgi:hypothetical protein
MYLPALQYSLVAAMLGAAAAWKTVHKMVCALVRVNRQGKNRGGARLLCAPKSWGAKVRRKGRGVGGESFPLCCCAKRIQPAPPGVARGGYVGAGEGAGRLGHCCTAAAASLPAQLLLPPRAARRQPGRAQKAAAAARDQRQDAGPERQRQDAGGLAYMAWAVAMSSPLIFSSWPLTDRSI